MKKFNWILESSGPFYETSHKTFTNKKWYPIFPKDIKGDYYHLWSECMNEKPIMKILEYEK